MPPSLGGWAAELVDDRGEEGGIPGCRFWMTLADNRRPNSHGTPDVVGFLIFNGSGQRVAYGTGPTSAGDITVAPTSN